MHDYEVIREQSKDIAALKQQREELVAENAGLREKLEARCTGLQQIAKPAVLPLSPGHFVNAAQIYASDPPGTVVRKLNKAFHDAATFAAPQAQAEDARDAEIALPKTRNAVRIGDIHPKDHIRLEFGFQNDVYVSIRDGYNYASIEFRKPGGDYSGRRSIRTYAALIALSVAMEADNAANPSSNPWAQNDEITAQAAKGETE